MSNLGPKHAHKFTKERQDAIVDAIAKSIPYQLAAEGNGIAEATLFDWIARGKRDLNDNKDTEYAAFSERIKKAELEKVGYHLGEIKGRPKNWQADAWVLERCYYRHFGANAHLIDLEDRFKRLESKSRGEGKEEE